MGRCEKCDKKASKTSKRSCKSSNHIKENNANNAQIINVDVIPESSQVQDAATSNAQNAVANNGTLVNSPQPLYSQHVAAPSASAARRAPEDGAFDGGATAGAMAGLTAEEVKNLLKGATDFATEAAGQGVDSDDDDDRATGRGRRASASSSSSGCQCGGNKKKKNNSKKCNQCNNQNETPGYKSSKKSKKVNKRKEKAKNNKVNVNLALILTRSAQTPTLAAAQRADNAAQVSPINAPVGGGGCPGVVTNGSANADNLHDLGEDEYAHFD